MTPKLVSFGEIMGRVTPEGFSRFSQVLPGPIRFEFGGAEANVAVDYALLGGKVRYVTALPDNPMGRAANAALQTHGVDTDFIQFRDEGRLGLYFLETGANQRPSRVIYDRAGSTVAVTQAYPWSDVFADADWFHFTGITPAISRCGAETTLSAVRAAKNARCRVSCDLNFRATLWRWDPSIAPVDLAGRTMRELLPYVDVLIGNEEDAEKVLGIRAAETDVEKGRLDVAAYPEVAAAIVKQFPQISHVATTLRESISASHNNWGGMLYEATSGTSYLAPRDEKGGYSPYGIRNIVDRVGGGDSFAAGLIFAMTTEDLSAPQRSLDFAVAASCLKHSILGDFNYVSRVEVESLAAGAASGRVRR